MKILYLLLLPASVLCIGCRNDLKSPDLILYNGKIITVDSSLTIHEAVSIAGENIVDVGTSSRLKELAGDSTKMINLRGHSVVPGLIEGHAHPVAASGSEFRDAIPVVNSVAELLTWIKQEAARKEPGQWIVHPKFFITRMKEMRQVSIDELDAASPNHPVFLNGSYGGMVNTHAMKLSGVYAKRHPGILRDERTGKPTGLIRQSAFTLLAVPKTEALTPGQQLAVLKQLFYRYNSVGFTSVCSGGGSIDELKLFRNLHESGELTVRLYHNVRMPFALKDSVSQISAELKKLGVRTGDGNEWVKVGALKIVLDGGMLTGTAYLHEGWGEKAKTLYGIEDEHYRGEIMYSKAQLETIIRAAGENGWKFTAHVTGGGGVDTLLAAYESVNSKFPLRDKRFSIIHGNFFTPQAIMKMSRLGIYADMQPAWFYKDTELLNHVLGEERMKIFHPYRSLVEAGVVINGGSDHMVKTDPDQSINPYNPFTAMWSVITRKTERGNVFNAGEALDRMEALKMFTINNALASFEEERKGSIESGKVADLVVLSDDLLTCPADSIKNIRPLMTIVGGRIVFESDTAWSSTQVNP